MKRPLLTSLLVLTMLLALAGTASASLVDIEDDPHREAIEKMVELGVLEGRGDGKFWPQDNLTRAEAAKVAAYLVGFDAQDAELARSWPAAFDDVHIGMGTHEWAVGWINLAAKEGLIAGHGDGTYGPGDNLQMVQWAAILVRILDHEAEDMSWPGCYDELAHGLGLTRELPYESSTHINRGEMARFTANAVYDVKRPDGSKILDQLQERMEDPDEEPDGEPGDPPTEIFVSTEVSPEFIPGGGGQVVSITVTVTDEGGDPIADAVVSFDAEAFEVGSRRGQLSTTRATTNSAGRAVVAYVTRAEDDDRQVDINVAVEFEHVMKHLHVEILASDSAARVTGTIYDPFTGDPVPGASVLFWMESLGRTTAVTVADDHGRYTSIVPTGEHHVNIEFPDPSPHGLRHALQEGIQGAGTSHTIDYDKGVVRGIALNWISGDEIIALPLFPGGVSDHTCVTEPAGDGSFMLFLKPGEWDLAILGRPQYLGRRITVKSGETNDVGAVDLRE